MFDAGNDFALIEVDQSHQGIPKRNKYRVVVTNPDGIDHQSEGEFQSFNFISFLMEYFLRCDLVD